MAKDKKKDAPHVRAVPDGPHAPRGLDLKPRESITRNPGMALELDWIRDIRVNRSAVERRAATLPARRNVKKEWQAAWLLRAIACMDLTTLSGDDTPGRVRRMCAKARRPVQDHVLDALDVSDLHVTTAAVCVYHEMVPVAVEALQGTSIPVAAVSTGFPHGLSPLKQRIKEIEASVREGAKEIDIVITRAHLFTGNWQAMYDEVKAYREACGEAHLKTILATGDLRVLRNVARASMVCMMAGADFIKTSTGKESVNATLPVSLVMVRMIRAYLERTGFKIGFKPAGGISTAKLALAYLALMKDELGRPWLDPELFRFGASSLLGDIERQLEYFVTGRYSAAYRHPIA
jgi:deoxyribose-phosphate aldolase